MSPKGFLERLSECFFILQHILLAKEVKFSPSQTVCDHDDSEKVSGVCLSCLESGEEEKTQTVSWQEEESQASSFQALQRKDDRISFLGAIGTIISLSFILVLIVKLLGN